MAKVFEKKALTKKSENIADWYNDVVLQAGLADYAPVKGCAKRGSSPGRPRSAATSSWPPVLCAGNPA